MPDIGDSPFRRDLLAGLARPRKSVPPKYFYDAEGSRLFDLITRLDEYYPTRTELSILRRHAAEMAARLGPDCLLVEPGAGSLTKARLLLERMERPAGFVPVDVSAEHLEAAAVALRRDFPALAVAPVAADFTRPFRLPELPAARRAVFFPGSTLGNFAPSEADELLRGFARLAGRGGAVLVGVDLRKDPAVLERAYNDAAGVTAAFNLNVLSRANRELGADFDLAAFRHRAFYNAAEGRVEMHLESLREQTVSVAGERFFFRAGETLHTEDSYKYDADEFAARAAACGLRRAQTWTDARRWFAAVALEA